MFATKDNSQIVILDNTISLFRFVSNYIQQGFFF